MAHSEIDSFVTKFKQLLHAGLKANLSVEASGGEATVTLKACLGQLPTHNFHEYPFHPNYRHRGPAYKRRQQRRKAAQESTESKTSNPAEEVGEVVVTNDESAAKVNDSLESETTEQVDAPNVNVRNVKNNEQLSFQCIFCDFKSSWSNGLEIHMSRKHATIEQLDGNSSVDEDSMSDEKYDNTKHYWEKGWLGTIFMTFLDANEVIDGSNLDEENKIIEKEKVLEARKRAFGENYKWYPPWK